MKPYFFSDYLLLHKIRRKFYDEFTFTEACELFKIPEREAEAFKTRLKSLADKKCISYRQSSRTELTFRLGVEAPNFLAKITWQYIWWIATTAIAVGSLICAIIALVA